MVMGLPPWLIHGLEVTLLHGQDLGQRLFTLFLGVGEDHLTHGSNTIRFKEHMLGTAQADALGAELAGLGGVVGGVRIGADLQAAYCRPSP